MLTLHDVRLPHRVCSRWNILFRDIPNCSSLETTCTLWHGESKCYKMGELWLSRDRCAHQQCSDRLRRSNVAKSELIKTANSPRHYSAPTSLNCWHEVAWVRGFMRLTPNLSLAWRLMFYHCVLPIWCKHIHSGSEIISSGSACACFPHMFCGFSVFCFFFAHGGVVVCGVCLSVSVFWAHAGLFFANMSERALISTTPTLLFWHFTFGKSPINGLQTRHQHI